MKTKKVLSAFLTMGMLSLSATGVWATDLEIRPISALDKVRLIAQQEVHTIQVPDAEVVQPDFASFSGIVQEINDHQSIEGAKFISLENEEGKPARAIVSETTYVAARQEIGVGSRITIFYDATKPMIMIYPPQYNARAVVFAEEGTNFKMDYFGANLVSSDNFLKLNVSEETKVIDEQGENYSGDIANKYLLVSYGPATKSIPAQTNPKKIVVLDVEYKKKTIDMVPLRSKAEQLGYKVQWNGQEQSIVLDDEVILQIGEKRYLSQGEVKELDAAPLLKDGLTYIPQSFFIE